MKSGIHPKLHEAPVTCSCGSTFTVLSVRDKIHVEVCSACHPLYTGKKRVVDTAGRVERFMARAQRGQQYGGKKPAGK